MRLTIIVALFLFPASVFAQSPPCSQSSSSLPQFDPYKPSHLAIVRNYGATVLSQASLDTLLKLDPYVPTEAALLRQVGGALPLWPYAYPGYLPARQLAPCESVPETATTTGALTTFSEVVARLERRTPVATTTTRDTAANRNLGVSIQHDGRVWISAGPAVRFSETDFVRIGDRAGSPIFRRAGGEDTVVYVGTTAGMVAPFRAVR
jgi:hypothetical protein